MTLFADFIVFGAFKSMVEYFELISVRCVFAKGAVPCEHVSSFSEPLEIKGSTWSQRKPNTPASILGALLLCTPVLSTLIIQSGRFVQWNIYDPCLV